MDETAYLLSSPSNVDALLKSIKNIKDGKVIEKILNELESTADE